MYYVSSIKTVASKTANTIDLDSYFYEIVDSTTGDSGFYEGIELRQIAKNGQRIVGYDYDRYKDEVKGVFCVSKNYANLLSDIIKLEVKCKLANNFVDLSPDFKGEKFLDITNLVKKYCSADNSIYIPVLDGCMDLDSKVLHTSIGDIDSYFLKCYFKTNERGKFDIAIEEKEEQVKSYNRFSKKDKVVIEYKPTDTYLFSRYFGIVYLLRSIKRNKYKYSIISLNDLEGIENIGSIWSIQRRQGFIKEVKV